MADVKALRKENSDLLKKIDDLNTEFQSLRSKMATSDPPKCKETERSLQFLSDEYEDIKKFAVNTTKEMQKLALVLKDIETRAKKIDDEVEAIQQYSYQYNLKITGIPMASKQESAIQTSETCIKLFHKIGASSVSIQDIDIAHRVPKRRKDSKEPPAIVCKFTRRLAKEIVLDNRRQAKNVKNCDLGLGSQVAIDKILILEHLTPKMQDLHYKCKNFKSDYGYKFCWVKNSCIYLRFDEDSKAIRIRKIEDLDELY